MSKRTIEVAILKISATRALEPYEAAVIRGSLGRMFSDEPLLHHHLENKLLYTYPKVQFKIIEGIAHIIGIEEGISVINNIKTKISKLKLERNKIELCDPEITIKNEKFGSTDNLHKYIFATIWMALNSANYQKYISSSKEEDILRLTLIGNILSMCKGLGYIVKDDLKISLDLKEVPTSLKGTPMLGFLGTFSVNFEIPDYWGIGKSVSRGFGTVKRISSEEAHGSYSQQKKAF